MAEVVTLQPPEPAEKPRFCNTPTAASITALLGYCQEFGELGVVVGEPGVGKTAAVTSYVAGHRGVWLVILSPSTSALVPCLTLICTIIAGFAPNTGALDVRGAILNRRCYLDPCLLILDEAQHLSDQAIEEVRALHDQAGMAVVFVGNRGLVDRWQTKPGVKRGTWAQLTSRIGPRLDITAPLPEDIDALCEHHGIAGKRARDLLRKAAAGHGGLRTVVKLIRIAVQLADGKPVEPRHLEEAAQLRSARG